MKALRRSSIGSCARQLQAVQIDDIISEEAALRFFSDAELLNVSAGSFGINDREIRTKDDLLRAPGVDEVHELRRPVGRSVGVGSNVDVRMLIGDGNHFL